MSDLNNVLEMTGCRDAADLQDMANVGKALMERMADVVEHGPLKGWMPADCPTEVVTDLANELDEARSLIADQSRRIDAWQQQASENDTRALAAAADVGELLADLEQLAEDAFSEGWRSREARLGPILNSRSEMRKTWVESNARDALLERLNVTPVEAEESSVSLAEVTAERDALRREVAKLRRIMSTPTGAA